jgi:hypothetical protein
VEILLERLPQLVLDSGATLWRQPNFSLRGWASVPVVFA